MYYYVHFLHSMKAEYFFFSILKNLIKIVDEEPDEEEGYKMFHHTAILENFSPFMVLILCGYFDMFR